MTKRTKRHATFQGAGDNKVVLRARPGNGAVDVIVAIGDGIHYGASLDIKTIQRMGVTAIEFGVVAELTRAKSPRPPPGSGPGPAIPPRASGQPVRADRRDCP